MTDADTPSREETLQGLIQDALDVLHHDASHGSDVDKYERGCLRKKFAARLAAKPDVREATIAECARLVETTGLNNKDNIARDIRALSRKPSPPVPDGTLQSCEDLATPVWGERRSPPYVDHYRWQRVRVRFGNFVWFTRVWWRVSEASRKDCIAPDGTLSTEQFEYTGVDPR